MKKILFIGGILPYSKIDEIMKNSKTNIDFAAHNFQSKIIDGIEKNELDYEIVSVPFISSYPKYYSKMVIPAYNERKCQFLKFNNLPFVKVISRYTTLKKFIKRYCKENKDFNVIIYSLHLPFLKVAKVLKKKSKYCEINLIVPDLQEYMSQKSNIVKKILNRVEINLTNKNLKYIDHFTFLTDYMNERLNKFHRPYTVIEGISNNVFYDGGFDEKEKYICYTGTLAKRYGVMNLVNAFLNIENPGFKLVICGEGEMASEIKKIALCTPSLIFKGLVSPTEAKKIQQGAFALVNPRDNNEEYTKYSFPSKLMEYISTGKPIICYKLDGFPSEYDDVLIYPKDDSIESFSETIKIVMSFDGDILNDIKIKSYELLENKTSEKSVKKIYNLYKNK